MQVRELNRNQAWLLPPTLDELIPEDHPARFVLMLTVVDSFDESVWERLDIWLEGDPLGAPAYHPKALLGGMAVWVYDQDQVVTKAGRSLSRSDALSTAYRMAASRSQHAVEILQGAQERDARAVQIDRENSDEAGPD